MHVDKQDVMDQIKIMAMAYPLKGMANALDKSYSTLSNELDERDWAKLGFRTVLSMISLSLEPGAPEQSRIAALKVLDKMESGFGRVAYTIPNVSDGMVDVLKLISSMSTEYAVNIKRLAWAMEDGSWTPDESEKCRGQNRELLKACLRIEAYLGQLEEALR